MNAISNKIFTISAITFISTLLASLSLAAEALPTERCRFGGAISNDTNCQVTALPVLQSGIRYWLDTDPRWPGVYYWTDNKGVCAHGGVEAGGGGNHCMIVKYSPDQLRSGVRYWLDTDPRWPGIYYSDATASQNFPLRGSQFTELGDHRRMETSVTISNNGRIDGVTRIWTDKQWSGFTGSVAVAITDSAGNILYVTEPHSYGVDCKRCPGPSKRTQQWADTVPSNILSQVKRYSIIHTTNPRNRWRDWLRDTKEAAQQIKEIKKEFE